MQRNIQKGITYLLEAFFAVLQDIPAAHLLLVGDGELKADIELFRREKNIEDNLHLVGFQDDIPSIMRTIDVLVLPSLWEGFGIVLIEAMAARKPCITTQVSSMPEIVIHDETGLVVPPKNSDRLADAIGTIINDKKLARKYGKKGRDIVKGKFTLEHMIQKYEDVFMEQRS